MSGADLDVVIIGAGAAGVAAGHRLAAAGARFRIIEARDRLGGRGFTVSDPRAGALDLGCGWLHSGDRNPWTAIAEAEDHRVDRTPAPWTRPALETGFPAAEQAAFTAARDDLQRRMGRRLETGGDEPASGALEPGGRWNGLLDAVSTYVSGAELEKVSARDLANYADSGVNWRVRGGYGALIVAHGAALPVTFGCAALRVDHSGRRVRIETTRGIVETSVVIVAVPASLIALGEPVFVPNLSEKRDAAAGLPLGLADKLYLALDCPDGFESDTRAFGRTDRVATAIYHIRPFGRPVIEAYFGGACAAELERGGAPAFAEFAIAELVGLFGAETAKRLTPLPMHLWAADPLARGSYSYAKPGHVDDRLRLAAPIDGRLFFAGEACSPNDYSTAHGAYRTGAAAAKAALESLGLKSP